MNLYTIEYYHNNVVYHEDNYELGDVISEPEKIPEKENHNFEGWVDSEGKEYTFGESVISTNLGKTLTLYSSFVEKNKWDINYYDGKVSIHEETLYEDSEITFVPIKERYIFAGWYIDEALEEPLSTDYTVKSNINLYAKFVKASYELNASDLAKESYKTTTRLGTTIYSLCSTGSEVKINEQKLEFNDITYTKYVNTNGSANFETKNRVIKIDAYEKGELTVLLYGDERTIDLYSETTKIDTFEFDGTTKFKTFSIPSSGNYYLGSTDGKICVYYLEFIPSPSAELNYQYNNDAAPTAIRFFGVLTNITDTNAIESIILTIESNGRTGTKNINTIWKSVNVGDAEGSNGATFEEATNTYYAVYSIVNIPETEIGQEYSVTITVVFTEASGIETINANRTFIMGQE